MQPEFESLSRRAFLKLTGAALATAAHAQSTPPAAPNRPAPTHPITLRTAALELQLDPVDGLPFFYRLAGGAVFHGETTTTAPAIRLCRLTPRDYATISVAAGTIRHTATTADVPFTAHYTPAEPAVSFTLHYELDHATLHVSLTDIHEHPGFELISVTLPALVTVTEEQPNAWLAHGDQGGSLVALRQAKPGTLAPNSFWGNIHGILPVIMAGHSGAVCVQETTAFMDGTLLSVRGEAPQRVAALGTIQQHRVDGSQCYDLNLGKGEPHNCGGATTPNLLVEDPSACRLDFLVAGATPLTWLDAAKLVRSRMPRIPNPYYHDRYIYGIRVDEPNFPKAGATFAQCEEIIRMVRNLTDGAPQLTHLWGWQFRGKDTGYPAVNVVDERLGGYDAMMRLKDRAKALNADVSLSDNYDDAYRSSSAWDEHTIARRPDGGLWKSRAWTGEESYIQGLAKYMEGPGPERVRYTCERYKLPGTIHVDVLSEGLRYPYIGKMSMAWYAGGPTPCPFGGSPIPMLPLIYRQSAVWGRASNRGSTLEENVWLHLYNGEAPHAIHNGDVTPETITDAFYLIMVPWFQLHQRNIEGYSTGGPQSRMTFAGADSFYELNWDSKAYRLVLDGREVAANGQTTCPLDANRMALYRTKAGPVKIALPHDWNPAKVKASALSPDRKETMEIKVQGKEVEVQLAERRPVILYRD